MIARPYAQAVAPVSATLSRAENERLRETCATLAGTNARLPRDVDDLALQLTR